MCLKSLVIIVAICVFGNRRCYCNEFGEEVKEVVIPLKIWNKFISKNFLSKNNYVESTERSPVTFVVPIYVTPDYEPDIAANVDETVESVITNSDINVEFPSAVAAPAATTAMTDVIMQATKYPCICKDLKCNCCTILFVPSWNQKGCAKVKFMPEEFAMEFKLTMNNDTVITRKLTAKDPPPFCFNPRRYPLVDVCARLYDIRIKGENAQVCIDMDATLGIIDLYHWNFNCLNFGPKGILTNQKPIKVKPNKVPAVNIFGNDNEDDESGDYFGGDDDDGQSDSYDDDDDDYDFDY